jgi:outer membrane protein TolC
MRLVNIPVLLLAFLYATIPLSAQLSFTSAVDLALRNSPRVKVAQDDVNRAKASLAELKSVFIPSVSGSIGAGPSYGITTSVPTIFTINAQSLAFDFSQIGYIRAERAGIRASSLALLDSQGQVEEDTAITYISLDQARQRQAAMAQEYGYALKMVAMIQDRLDAGIDTAMELRMARRTAVQVRLQQLQLDDEIASLRNHFSQLIGLPADKLETVSDSIPADPMFEGSALTYPNAYPDTPGVLSAEASAQAKREQALGESHSTWRPQISFVAQYARMSPFNGASTYYNLNGNYNSAFAAAQIRLPFFDHTHRAKARESLVEAERAGHTVEFLREQQNTTRVKLQHSITELATKAELAELNQGISEDQLNAVLEQLASGNGRESSALMTPKDEMNVRIQERQSYLEMLDVATQSKEAQIHLLRQTGRLEVWIRALVPSQANASIRP